MISITVSQSCCLCPKRPHCDCLGQFDFITLKFQMIIALSGHFPFVIVFVNMTNFYGHSGVKKI